MKMHMTFREALAVALDLLEDKWSDECVNPRRDKRRVAELAIAMKVVEKSIDRIAQGEDSRAMGGDESRLEVEEGSVKWITPWSDCTVRLDDDAFATLSTTPLPSPVFSPNEWRDFCAAVNLQINQKTKD